jgi:hypothetical protein
MDEVPIINEEHQIQGHTDGLLKLSASEIGVLEIKSMNDRNFTQLKDAKEEHKMQALIYLFGLEERRKFLRENYTNITDPVVRKMLYKEYEKSYSHMQEGSKHSRKEKITHQIRLCYERDKLLFNTRVPLTKCVILYENKNTQDLKEFTVEMVGENLDLLNYHLDIFDYVSECVCSEEVPERAGKNKSDATCRWCDYRGSCFIV